MNTTFVFIRHAQSVAKDKNMVQGRGEEVPLSDLGREQAALLPERLKGFTFDRLFSSASVRAIDTVRPLLEIRKDVPYESIELLHERSKGEAEGLSKEEFARQYASIEEAWEREEDPRVPGGENFSDVERRVMPIIEEHLRVHRGKTLVYVIHGNVIRVILGVMLGIPPEKRNRIAQDYCGISVAEFDGTKERWKVRSVNAQALP